MVELSDIEKNQIETEFNKIFENCKGCNSSENKKLITKAFKLANNAHKNMRRRSGEPYIYHPISVAQICVEEIGLGTKSVVCALLHDVVEDTDYSIEDIENLFGKKIAIIIDGLTKISGVFEQKSQQAENFRKMLLTLSEDVRVILIKLADRLHNMRTLDYMPERKQLKIASETLSLYAPLAHRLGLYNIKTELEDLSLKYKHPVIYNKIKSKVVESEDKRKNYIDKFSIPIIDKLKSAKVNYTINGRPKSIYSIWNKMNNKKVDFDEIYDLFAIRIVFKPEDNFLEKTQCWNIYSLITDIYQPNPNRLRDWVSTPKTNGYEALHTTVIGPEGRWVEVQIRSERMNEIAERGYAAHYKYKGDKSVPEGELDNWLIKIRDLLKSSESNALEFLDNFKLNFYSNEVYVFTPKGQLIRLPKNATALDFAYEIHTKIGDKSIGAKINHKLEPLSKELNSGDKVEILTSEKQFVDPKRINYVVTAKAKNALKSINRVKKVEYIESGKKILQDKFKELKPANTSLAFRKLFIHFEVRSKDELYCKIGRGAIDIENISKIINKKSKNKIIRYWQLQFSRTTNRKKNKENTEKHKIKQLKLFDNFDEKSYILSKCCKPIPGDKVAGIINKSSEIEIHKISCDKFQEQASINGNNIVDAKWAEHKILSFLSSIEITGLDKIGILNKITEIISKELNVNMRSVSFDSSDGVFKGTIYLYIHNKEDLDELINNIKKIKGVKTVDRIE